MRVVIAPGRFGSELSATEAATAIARGWARRAPGDDLVIAPVSDGGPGYLAALQVSLGGDLVATVATSPWGEPRPVRVLVAGATGYVEAAEVVGEGAAEDHAVGDPETASSAGVGELVRAAVGLGVERVVVGVGRAGVVTNDGGAGLLSAVGATSDPPGALTAGAVEVSRLERVDLLPATQRLRAIDLVLATDDDCPLLGLLGTTNTAGSARGLSAEQIPKVDRWLEHLADLVGRRTALVSGAGAGGGVGFGLLSLGAGRTAGLGGFMAAIGLSQTFATADLVVTGERAFDLSAGSGELATGVAGLAGAASRPCLALAERVAVGARESRALGIESAYGVNDLVDQDHGGTQVERLEALAERVARSWSWTR